MELSSHKLKYLHALFWLLIYTVKAIKQTFLSVTFSVAHAISKVAPARDVFSGAVLPWIQVQRTVFAVPFAEMGVTVILRDWKSSR